MKEGFSLVELIISIGLISVITLFAVVSIKKINPTYADPYEDMRSHIANATNLYLNTNSGLDYKTKLYSDKSVSINSNYLIEEGLLEENYFVENINENKNTENLTIIITLDEEGFMNYSINIE